MRETGWGKRENQGDLRARFSLSGEEKVPTRILTAPAPPPLAPDGGWERGNGVGPEPGGRRDLAAGGRVLRLLLPKTPPNPGCQGPSAGGTSLGCSPGGSVGR